MAVLVAFSMREGFAQYLLKGELAELDDLTAALSQRYSGDAKGWPDLTADPQAWHAFVRRHFTPKGPEGRPKPSPPQTFPNSGESPLTFYGPSGEQAPGAADRLVLLDAKGTPIIGRIARNSLFERRQICAPTGCSGAGLLGYIGINAPVFVGNTGDAFFLTRQYSSLALAALIAILISASAAFLVARQLLIPIRKLEAGAKALVSGNSAARITQDRDDELGHLINHYKTLSENLDRTSQAEREWISNTSHELQTPLAVLRAQIEALQDGIRKPDAKTLGEMHGEMMRLSRLVQDLKTLSHAREAELVTSPEGEDLAEIALEAAQTARPILAAKGIKLQLELPASLPFSCDRERIAQVIDTLLQNAARYTDGPGLVRLRASCADDFVELCVEDTPPCAPPDDLPKLFDRFYRAETSRSRDSDGSGLGLAICKAIVEAHSGKISAGNAEIGGLRITVKLPKERP